MTSDVAFDSCVAAKWVLSESDTNEAQNCLAKVLAGGGKAHMFDLALAEVGNAIWKHESRGMIDSTQATRAWTELTGLTLSIEPAVPLIPTALSLARKHGISVYDALFASLVQRLGVMGVTSDQKLANKICVEVPSILLLSNWP